MTGQGIRLYIEDNKRTSRTRDLELLNTFKASYRANLTNTESIANVGQQKPSLKTGGGRMKHRLRRGIKRWMRQRGFVMLRWLMIRTKDPDKSKVGRLTT